MIQGRAAAECHDPNYQAYLIRMWRDESGKPWRASAVAVATGEARSFVSLADLYAFLDSRTDAATAPAQD